MYKNNRIKKFLNYKGKIKICFKKYRDQMAIFNLDIISKINNNINNKINSKINNKIRINKKV